MATSAISSHGTLLKIHDGASTYTTIAEVLDITGGGTELMTEDATNHDSSGWFESAPTIKKGNEVTFDINYYSATTQDQLETDQGNRTKRLFQIVFPLPSSGTDTRQFSAYIKNVEPQAPVAGLLRMSVTLEPTGAITKTIA